MLIYLHVLTNKRVIFLYLLKIVEIVIISQERENIL